MNFIERFFTKRVLKRAHRYRYEEEFKKQLNHPEARVIFWMNRDTGRYEILAVGIDKEIQTQDCFRDLHLYFKERMEQITPHNNNQW